MLGPEYGYRKYAGITTDGMKGHRTMGRLVPVYIANTEMALKFEHQIYRQQFTPAQNISKLQVAILLHCYKISIFSE